VGGSLVACSDAARVLQPANAVLDTVPRAVERRIVWKRRLAALRERYSSGNAASNHSRRRRERIDRAFARAAPLEVSRLPFASSRLLTAML
jgi:hypothetical protein